MPSALRVSVKFLDAALDDILHPTVQTEREAAKLRAFHAFLSLTPPEQPQFPVVTKPKLGAQTVDDGHTADDDHGQTAKDEVEGGSNLSG
ncbi:unnamed protein product [Vitrella brassicaformis CCMP3155]|uniref:Uncharacterized protein n=1 Tax=Vitrella brassicaformis (strain CCMP3155) TaxID=1169540 RepID=A0A0G4H6B1_VITBC|nr:unnamed protein product [Vitrella brassicaformis CCMP3155]|eukprot:CEM39402.1 unnamed protein product [Vitrella brassicaformis CCMP3155]